MLEQDGTESGKIKKDSPTILYSGGEEHRNGVGKLMNINNARSIIGYWPISNRLIMVKLQGKPFDINILQTYAPTQDHNDEDIEQFYEEIQQAINQAKSDEIICMMDAINVKNGSISHSNIVGNFGLCDKKITNTQFQQQP